MSQTDAGKSQNTGAPPGSWREVAMLFLKLGLIGFGGPAAHTAMMHEEVVNRRRWMSREEFLDLLGATNLIPGPNSTELAIHIGHRQDRWPCLLVAVPRIWRPPTAGAVLDGVNAASLSLMAFVSYQLGRAALMDIPAIILAVASAIVLVRFRINSAWLVLGGAVTGLALYVKA